MGKNISYIPSFSKKDLISKINSCNDSLARLKRVMEAHSETLEEAIIFQEKGWDYQIREKQEECLQWMESVKMPSYLKEQREQYLLSAIQSLGEDRIQYFQQVGKCLPIYYGSEVIDLKNNISVENGKWVLNEAYIQKKTDEVKRTLTDQQMEDLEILLKVGEELDRVKSLGYDLDYLDKFSRDMEEEKMAELLINVYSPAMDSRLSLQVEKN